MRRLFWASMPVWSLGLLAFWALVAGELRRLHHPKPKFAVPLGAR
jgi:hypothetical protein